MTDFEHVLQDNLYLRKHLQTARNLTEKLQNELEQERRLNQQIIEKNAQLGEIYGQLQRKYQLASAEYGKDISTLQNQIAQLKDFIDHKQRQIEQFQLKMIPNIDQDMLRVKLITQMEGPYQEVVDKKDHQINRLKDRLSEAQRKASLFQMQLQTKQKDYRREITQMKRYYEQENDRLSRELNIAMAKKQVRPYDQQLFRNQRKQLEELRCTIGLQQQNESQLRKQVAILKMEKEKLALNISELNEKKALQIHLSSENQQIRALKIDKKRIQDELNVKIEEVDKLTRKIKGVQKQSTRIQQQLRKAITHGKQTWELQREEYREQISKHKRDLRKIQDKVEKSEQEFADALHKLQSSERQLTVCKEQCDRLKNNIKELEITVKQLQFAKKQKLTLSKDLEQSKEKIVKQKNEELIKKQNNSKYINNEDNIINKRAENRSLEKINAKLKEKLQLANQKIVQLLKQKVQKPISGNYGGKGRESDFRQRAFSNIQLEPQRTKTDKTFLLQYRDVGFVPLVTPTLFTQPY